jgi:hypothetical protein
LTFASFRWRCCSESKDDGEDDDGDEDVNDDDGEDDGDDDVNDDDGDDNDDDNDDVGQREQEDGGAQPFTHNDTVAAFSKSLM